MSNIYHVTTQLGRMDSFFLEANSSQDIINLLNENDIGYLINRTGRFSRIWLD